MTEYWKSQARKYCEFCKCWFADNKVSISFHENGKKHKENVQKHISQLSKRSAKDQKQKDKMDDDIKKMEQAAMAAYLKDVQNNADLTSKNINEMLGQDGHTSNSSNINITVKSNTKSPTVWQEVRSDDGSSYFWNIQTNETTWDAPDEYLSIVQQEKQKLEEEEAKKAKHKLKKEKQKEAFKEAKAYVAREQMKELAVNKNQTPSIKYEKSIGPAPRMADPLGAWTPVVNEPVEKINLQLPKPDKGLLPPPVVMEPEIIQFKEKRVESLGDEPVEFKKRKLNNAKRNIRQKLDDE